MKKLFSLFTILSLMLVVTGCGKEKSTDIKTINFWHHYSAQSKENEILVEKLIPKFEEENPGIKINAVSHEWADLHDKILVSASSGTVPDIARLDLAWIPEFHSSNLLISLNTEFDDFNDVYDSLLENAMDTTKIKNDYYGLALNINTKILFCNTQMLKENNIDIPNNMKEFEESIKKISGKNDNGQKVWGYNEPSLSGWNVLPLIWSFGGDILNEDQTSSKGFINSRETINAIKMIKDMYDSDELTGWGSGDIPMTDGFATNRYAFVFDGPWKIAELKEGYPELEYSTVNIPEGDGGSYSILGGESISLFNDSQNREEAWLFAKFMTSEYAQEEMSKANQIPVNKVVLDSDSVKDKSFYPFLEAIETAKSRPTVSNWTEIDDLLTTKLTNIMSDKVGIEEGLNELANEIDDSLKKEK